MIALVFALLLMSRSVALYAFGVPLSSIDYVWLLCIGFIAVHVAPSILSRTVKRVDEVGLPPLPQGVRPGYVYLVQGQQGYYKIGRTADPNDRLRTFKLKLPFDVEYLHLIACGNRFAVEAILHRSFDHRRVPGSEWFKLTRDDIALIKSIKEM